jgi:uncharacterized SAM-binding protein YcdF (DUF218 family)
MFTIKKILSAILLPIPLAGILGVIALTFLAKKKLKIAIICLSLSLSLLYLTGITPIASSSNKILETQYTELKTAPKSTHTLLVLSGGSNSFNSSIPSHNLSSITLCRTLEGIRLARQLIDQHRTPLLILSGGGRTGRSMQKTAILLGIPKKDTQVSAQGKDTRSEAQTVKKQLHNHPFILVTSASHMPRAMHLFQRLHMQPIAAPSCYSYKMHNSIALLNWIPRASRIALFNHAWHEYLGLLWSHIHH